MYPSIEPTRKHGDEPILAANGESAGTLLDFWSWAYSDLMGNAERGAFAEYLVALALGLADYDRISWDRYDLCTPEGVSIEVKTSGYLQTWEQKNLSAPIFGIRPTYGWDSTANLYSEERIRQAKVYVFCHHKHKEQTSANPLDTRQWDFYILPTEALNREFGEQKSASLRALVRAGARKCSFETLRETLYGLFPDTSA